METDESLPRRTGAELISPPIPLQQFLKICPRVFKAVDTVGTTTNKCGFHVSISFKGAKFEPNLLKLMAFIDEKTIYKVFNKAARHKYGGPIKELILEERKKLSEGRLLIDVSMDLKQVTGMEEALNQTLANKLTKQHGINPGKLQQGYIEFRYMGGAGYHAKWNKIKEIIGMYVAALQIAMDPEYKKQEYQKKIKNLVKVEVVDQQELIDDTKLWIPKIERLLKLSNIEIDRILRNRYEIFFVLKGNREDLEEKLHQAEWYKDANRLGIYYLPTTNEYRRVSTNKTLVVPITVSYVKSFLENVDNKYV